jgi:outer membrane protein TolC
LQQAVEYALKNNINIQNAQIDVSSAAARVGEIRAIGLPQISATAGIQDNIKIQTVFLPATFLDPKAPADAPPVPARFGVKFQGSATVTASQILFSNSYLIGLKASRTYQELYQKNLRRTQIETVEAVTKAYYGVLVNEERLGLLDYNVKRLDTLLQQTKATFQNGLVEKIDVDRIEVQYNNLQTELQNTTQLVDLSYALLKFQMGLKIDEKITLASQLNNSGIDNLPFDNAQISDYSTRIEFSTLQTQQKLAELDLRNIRSGYIPSLALNGSYGYNNGKDQLSQIFNTPWFELAYVGIGLNIPIFDGLTKYYKTQQAKLTLKKTEISLGLLRNSIDLELRQSNINLGNGLARLKTQKRNLDLAQEITRVTRIKYQQGVGSNIEVINAEGSLREAQTNYYAALYDALIAKVDQDKATGKLYNK